MKPFRNWMAVAFSVLLLFSLGNLLAADEEMATSLKGELVSVNPDTHSFIVKDSTGNNVEFTYNDKTEISGATETIEGLAGETGTSVTVYYREEANSKFATKVEVKAREKDIY
jgi:hypothetical protein